MSKGIVMEKHRNYTIVLTRDGSFQKAVLANKDAVVGEEVYFESFRKQNFSIWNFNNKRFLAMRFVSVAALVAVFVFSTFYLIGENKTYAYVTVDINPSIELAVNKSLQVQDMTAINTDAEKLLSSLSNYKQEDLQTVIDKIMQQSEKQDMVNEAKNILIGVSYADEPQKKIVKSINQYFQSNNTEWEIITFNVPAEIRKKAAENNSSMNEELAILIRDKNSDKLTIDEQKKELIHSFYYQETKTKEINQLQKTDVVEPNNIKIEEKIPKADKSDAPSSRNVEAPKNDDTNQNVNISEPNESQDENVKTEQRQEPKVKKEKPQKDNQKENNKHEMQKKNENSHKNNGKKEADDKEKHNKQWKNDKKPNEHGMKMKEKNGNKDNGNKEKHKEKHFKNHKDNGNKGNHGKD